MWDFRSSHFGLCSQLCVRGLVWESDCRGLGLCESELCVCGIGFAVLCVMLWQMCRIGIVSCRKRLVLCHFQWSARFCFVRAFPERSQTDGLHCKHAWCRFTHDFRTITQKLVANNITWFSKCRDTKISMIPSVFRTDGKLLLTSTCCLAVQLTRVWSTGLTVYLAANLYYF
jgi:hypothetical protein